MTPSIVATPVVSEVVLKGPVSTELVFTELPTELPFMRRSTAISAGWARFAEFLLVGGATLPALGLSIWLQHQLRLPRAEFGTGFLFFYAAFVINDPHFAVTYLLFYRDVKARAFGSAFCPAQRIRYWVAGFGVPLVLLVWAGLALGLRSAPALGWLIQLMFLLVGWHYVKQGFGVLMVLSARRGVRFSARERSVFLLHCLAGWAYAWANPALPARENEEHGVVYWAVAHPRALEMVALAVLAMSSLALLATLLLKWRRERRLPPLAALTGFLLSIWSWSIYSGADPLLRYAIPALHSLQYLYFVGLWQGNQAREEEGPPNFGRPLAARLGVLTASALGLGWLLFHGAPGLLDEALVPSVRGREPGPLGPTPFFAACFAIVNLHHYFMDHVIWRRENPETRFLRSTRHTPETLPIR
jgi:hypothetical protein